MYTVKETRDRINDDIVEIVSHYVELNKKGKYYTGSCPFHTEKTPSFTVTPGLGIYYCYGCQKGGDAIDFIQSFEGCDFKEAIKIGAEKLNIDFSWKEVKDFDEQKYKHEESLMIVCRYALDFFQEQLTQSKTAQKYLKDRNIDTDNDFKIGYAPPGSKLLEWAKAKGIKTEILLETGLIKENSSTNQLYDYFRDRIMFPICSPTGKVIAFTSRALENKKEIPKYLNSPETPIYTKGKELFALNLARQKARNENRIYLVEGNFDAMRLHQIGVTNTIAPCGTALTADQIDLLKKYSSNITLVYDGDVAGKKAIKKNSESLIKKQFNVNVISLPEGEDPDSFFINRELFDVHEDEHSIDYIVAEVRSCSLRERTPSRRIEFMNDIVHLLSHYESQTQDSYFYILKDDFKPIKSWRDALNKINREKSPKEYKQKNIMPAEMVLALDEHGFYVDGNCYYFKTSRGDNGGRQVSNFILDPLFHIESTMNAKRTFEVTNERGLSKVVEIAQKDLNTLSGFRLNIESLGNFYWDGSEADLSQLKKWLYAHTESCTQINQLGWQRDGFFAWGNGIFADGEFKKADKIGIVRHEDKAYYLPAFSRVFEREVTLHIFEKNFAHTESNITMSEYMRKFTTVHGDNGKIAFCFFVACLFRDIIVGKFRVFPLLNMFGPKGSGKSGCADSIVQFFGKLSEAPNLISMTKAAMGEHIAAASNALCVLDEYRNDIDVEKREILKSIWGGTGRTRMNMDKDKKRETTAVDQGVVITGQQMADADPALLSRFIFLSFTNDTHTTEERDRYVELREIEKGGITHLTHRILKLRPVFKENYSTAVKRTQDELNKKLNGTIVMDRIFNNWMTILAAYTTLEEYLELPWKWEELIEMAASKITTQSRESEHSDDLGRFWKVVEYLVASDILFEGGDYKIKYEDKVVKRYSEGNKWKKGIIPLDKPTNILFLNPARVMSLYLQQSNREGIPPLPTSTIRNYLKNSKAFICETNKENFKKINTKSGTHETRGEGKAYTCTTALVFNYDKLPLSIQRQTEEETEVDETVTEAPNPDTQTKFPF